MNTNVQSSKILRDNLNVLHSARKAFIESKNSERIKRALNHNTQSSGDTKYTTSGVVYYKEMTVNSGKVLEQSLDKMDNKSSSNMVQRMYVFILAEFSSNTMNFK